MVNTPTADLLKDLEDAEFSKFYGVENVRAGIGIALLKARELANLTQKELADKVGFTEAYIRRVECGEANPSLSVIGIIFGGLGLQLDIKVKPLYPVTP